MLVEEKIEKHFNEMYKANSKYIKYVKIFDPNITYTMVKISEVSGGSCWSEDYHIDTDIPNKELREKLYIRYANRINDFSNSLGIEQYELDEYLKKTLKQEDTSTYLNKYTNYEYYGNSTTYGLYVLNIQNMVKDLASEEINKIYNEYLKIFIEKAKNIKNIKFK